MITPSMFNHTLDRAVASNQKEIVSLLLGFEQFVEISPATSKSLVFWAVEGGDEALSRRILATYEAYINSKDAKGYTPLSIASASGLANIVEAILHIPGVEVNAHSGEHGSALQAASSGGHESIVRMLLNRGADVNIEGGFYGTAVAAALDSGSRRIFDLLVDHGAKINALSLANGVALGAASLHGIEHAVKILLDNGADVNIRVAQRTALQAAAQGGHERIVRLLLDKGADINADGRGGSALYAAKQSCRSAVADLLSEKGAEERLPVPLPTLEDFQVHSLVTSQPQVIGERDPSPKPSFFGRLFLGRPVNY